MEKVQFIFIKIISFLKSKVFQPWIPFLIFLIINLIQGIFTPLLNDESYYWLYSQNIHWGYLDHPPMIAWLIHLGGLLLGNEIGVRLFTIILGSLSFFFIYQIIQKEQEKEVNYILLLLLLGSSIFINFYSFLAIPDTPLLFFTVFFFWQYQRFLKKDSFINSILLGIISALLLYSKYHGILVIGFTVLANLKLLSKKSFYLVFITTLLLFTPHILWQLNNDFLTLRFHLMEKGNEFRFKNTLLFLQEQTALTGPILLLLFTILQKTKNKFQFTLKFVTMGIFLFFLLSTFRGMVNAYWTLAAWPGLIILSYFYVSEMKQKKSLVINYLIFCVVVISLLRINFIFNIIPIPNFNNRNPKEMVRQLKKNSEHPLVFENMFIDPSSFLFYEGDSCFAINNIGYKKTQFNFLGELEQYVQDKTVTLVTVDAINNFSRKISIPKGKRYFLTDIDHFKSFQSNGHVNIGDLPEMAQNTEVTFPLSIEFNSKNKIAIKQIQLTLNMLNRDNRKSYTFQQKINFQPNETINFSFIVPKEKGNYKSFFSIASDTLAVLKTYNSNIFTLTID